VVRVLRRDAGGVGHEVVDPRGHRDVDRGDATGIVAAQDEAHRTGVALDVRVVPQRVAQLGNRRRELLCRLVVDLDGPLDGRGVAAPGGQRRQRVGNEVGGEPVESLLGHAWPVPVRAARETARRSGADRAAQHGRQVGRSRTATGSDVVRVGHPARP
jgi:hypothetical protein